MAEEISQDETTKNSEWMIARLQQKALGHGSRCPAWAGHDGIRTSKFSGHPYMKHLLTSGAHHGRDLQAVFDKQYFLKKNIFSREHSTTTSLVVVFLQFVSLILHDLSPQAYLYIFYTIRVIICYNYWVY